MTIDLHTGEQYPLRPASAIGAICDLLDERQPAEPAARGEPENRS